MQVKDLKPVGYNPSKIIKNVIKIIDILKIFWQGVLTIIRSGISAPVSSGFFVPEIWADMQPIWWVERAEYNTRKGNKPRRLRTVVKTRRLNNAAQLLNSKEVSMSEPKGSSIQEVSPIFPDDYKVIKKTKEDGTIVYEHPIGEEIETYTNSLDMMMDIIINRFDAVSRLMGAEDYDRIGFLIEALVADARREIYETFHFLNRTIGEINCVIIQKNQTIYRHGRILAVELEGRRQ